MAFLRLDNLSLERKTLLEEILKRRGLSTGVSGRIPRRRDDKPALASFAQQRLWFIDQVMPGTPIYNCPSALLIKGPLNTNALERSLSEIVRRHEVFRTSFNILDGQPHQIVSPPEEAKIPALDLSSLSAPEREQRASDLTMALGNESFDLSRGRLFRAALIRMEQEVHVLAFTMHHIISDGWSLGILLRELSICYEAFVEDKAPDLPELAITYSDFSHWQREYFNRKDFDRQIDYWRKQLEGWKPGQFQWDRGGQPSGQRGARHTFFLSPQLTGALQSLARIEGVTVFMVLLAIFKTLFYRYTGREDIAFAAPIANRDLLDAENLVGVLANTVILRTKLHGDPSFRELLARIKETAIGAFSNQEVPFERVVEELHLPRAAFEKPVCEVVFDLENAPRRKPTLAGLQVQSLDIDWGLVRADLECHIWPEEEGIEINLIYNLSIFNQSAAVGMEEHFRALLAQAIDRPDMKLIDFDLGKHTTQVFAQTDETQGFQFE